MALMMMMMMMMMMSIPSLFASPRPQMLQMSHAGAMSWVQMPHAGAMSWVQMPHAGASERVHKTNLWDKIKILF